MTSIPFVLSAAALLLSTIHAGPVSRRNNESMVYSFRDVTPSPEIVWTSCYDNFTCALLQVPLDYTDHSIGNTNVAFIKKWSKNETAEDVLMNPGGPGFSGIQRVLELGDFYFNNVIGPQYNLVSFDPRGVNDSGIDLECFPGNPGAKITFGQETLDRAVDDTSQVTLYEHWELDRGWGERCTAAQTPEKLNQYANTVAVANDMRHYIELRAEALGHSPEESKLWFYGSSYGTVLGATYAALFPDRIGRMILDGNMDVDDYYVGSWTTALRDTDAAGESFFASCFEAGPELCVFHGNASSTDEIEQRFYTIFNDIKERPILMSDITSTFMPILVTWREIKSYFFNALYDSLERFPILAAILVDLEQRNASTLAVSSGRFGVGYPLNSTDEVFIAGQARTQIACMDQAGRFNLSTFETYQEHVASLVKKSFFGGNLIAAIVGSPCREFHIQPPNSQLFEGLTAANETSAPILFIGNTLDPVTPLHSAKKMSLQFGGSRVLTVEGTAHCSLRLRNECIFDHVHAYLADATLPPTDTICKAVKRPFFD